MPPRPLLLLPFLLGALLPVAAAAEDDTRPSASTPFAVSDAYTNEAGAFQIQGNFGYERARGGGEDFRPAPVLKYGVTDWLELDLGAEYGFGNGSGVNQGSLAPGVTFRVMEQDGLRPTLALIAGVPLPFGPGHGGTATELGAATSWVTGRGPGAWGLHLQGSWRATIDPQPEERGNGWLAGAAISHVVAPAMELVAAYSQRSQDRGERNLSVIEAGFIRGLTDQLSLGVAAGAGLNRDSPRLRLAASLSYSFTTGR